MIKNYNPHSFDILDASNPVRTWLSGACSPTTLYALVAGAFLGGLLWDALFNRAAFTNGENLGLLGLLIGLAAWNAAAIAEVRTLRRANNSDPNGALAYWGRGRAFHEVMQYARAIEAYEQFLRLESAGPLADLVRRELEKCQRANMRGWPIP